MSADLFSLPPQWRKGRGWWWTSGGAVNASDGADALTSPSLRHSGHTTTQPSSIEEEGFMGAFR